VKKIFILATIVLVQLQANAQSVNDTIYKAVQKGIKIPIGNTPDFFVKVGASTQLWTRFMQLNPETSTADGENISYDADFLVRRMFFPIYVKMGNFTFFSLPAFSSQTANSSISPASPRSVVFYFYDIWTSYKFLEGKIIIGTGLNMYNGLSRYSSASSARTMGADVPLIAAPNLTTTEQAARQLSLFFTGNLNSFAYRLAIAKPFVCNTVPENPEIGKVYHYANTNFSYKGYFEYQFFDKESNAMPYKCATHIGTKRMFNIGLGFDYHPSSTLSFNPDGSTTKYNVQHFAADIFYEQPFTNRSAVTFYLAGYLFDYGPGFTQTFGIQDLYQNGISEIQYGTGNAAFLQAAYLLPTQHLAKRTQFFYEGTLRNYEGADKEVYHHNLGMNYFIVGHKLKLTLQYENRPVFYSGGVLRKSLVIGKIQIGI